MTILLSEYEMAIQLNKTEMPGDSRWRAMGMECSLLECRGLWVDLCGGGLPVLVWILAGLITTHVMDKAKLGSGWEEKPQTNQQIW